MSKRLQVMFEETELDALRASAERQGLTVSELVRRTMREARRREPSGDIDHKLRVFREAGRHNFPTADIEQMLEETARGRGDPSLPD
ncbi:MAG: antitoxin [Thermoleophilaceae bacterium]|nr:antitoxin [Thermoleophilaceae bacterium]